MLIQGILSKLNCVTCSMSHEQNDNKHFLNIDSSVYVKASTYVQLRKIRIAKVQEKMGQSRGEDRGDIRMGN